MSSIGFTIRVIFLLYSTIAFGKTVGPRNVDGLDSLLYDGVVICYYFFTETFPSILFVGMLLFPPPKSIDELRKLLPRSISVDSSASVKTETSNTTGINSHNAQEVRDKFDDKMILNKANVEFLGVLGRGGNGTLYRTLFLKNFRCGA